MGAETGSMTDPVGPLRKDFGYGRNKVGNVGGIQNTTAENYKNKKTVVNTCRRRTGGQLTDLVEPLSDEVGGEVSLKFLLVLEGVVELRIRHGARLEPAVKDLSEEKQRPNMKQMIIYLVFREKER